MEQQKQANAKQGLALQSAQQLAPTENALALQKTQDDLHENALQNSVDHYLTTGNLDPLKQSITAAYGGNVKLDQMPDGSVQIQGPSGVKRFESMDAFLKVVKPVQSEWVSAGDGYAVNRATGEAKQLYQKAQKPAELPVDALTLDSMTENYLKDKGIDLPKSELGMLQTDLQARAEGLMRNGADPSVAVQQAYQSLEPAVSTNEYNMFRPWDKANAYDPSKVALSGSGAAVPAAPASAVNYLKQNDTPSVRAMFQQKYGYLP
ncbi:hypothetical protein J9253_05840 [Thiothrix litoralis]|uniref:Uncharacterized protein n=1 Tax=Thiothrix litoralis TaxID=2891210 RepID=A0ABX7WYS8_9GAMM|nr:hypothetical protein [Thiothrix litoralis]QTR47453.1 hypothetical protein J9253_05840 [Thiothrix litoralis]